MPEPTTSLRPTFRPKITTHRQLVQAYLTTPLTLREVVQRTKLKQQLRRRKAKRKTLEVGVLRRTHVLPETGESLPYALYVPRTAAKSDKPMPLLLALHGLAYTYDWAVGLENLVDYAEANGMLIVSPLGYSEGGWYGAPDLTEGGARSEETRLSEADVWRVLQLAMKEYRIDPRRVYAWGFSMGGGGALHLALQRPTTFRAIGLVAPALGIPPRGTYDGGIPPFYKDEGVDLRSLRHLNVAVVYGTRDRLIDVGITRGLIDDLAEAGVDKVMSVEVEGGRHDCEALVDDGRLERMLDAMLRDFGSAG